MKHLLNGREIITPEDLKPGERMKPSYCPICGKYAKVVRHITSNAFEMQCTFCDFPCVVLTNDHVTFSE
jgi:hypothetical protein